MSTGKFVWYDYNAKDVDDAIAFYSETVGWKTQRWSGDSDEPYTMFAAGEQPVGGVMELPEQAREMGAPPHWLAYVSVDDIRASIDRAKSLDAQVIVDATPIPEMGSFAVLSDPQGAVFAIYQSDGDDGTQPSPETPGAFSWHELYTEDFEGAWDFYTELFGWKQTDTMEMGEMGEYRMFGPAKGETLGGMMAKPDEFPMSAWAYYVTVADIDAAIGRAESHGGTKMFGPNEVPGGGKTAMITDNQGGVFAFYSPA